MAGPTGATASKHDAADPARVREAEVAQRLDEGPLVVDPRVQVVGGEGAGAAERVVPQAVEGGEGLAEAVGVGGSHQGAVGHPAVELRLDEGDDVDAVDDQATQLAVDLQVGDLGAGHPYAVEVGRPHPGAAQVDVAQGRVGEVDALEGGAAEGDPGEGRPVEVLLGEVGHGGRLGPVADVRRPQRAWLPGELDLHLVGVAELDLDLEAHLVGHPDGDPPAVAGPET
jgi:hypothetical protein